MIARVQQLSTGHIVTLAEDQLLAAGGEAKIFNWPMDPMLVAKIYHKPAQERAQKLRAMLANPPVDPMLAHNHASIAWPVDLIHTPDKQQRILGFLMPRAQAMRRVIDYFNPKTRRLQCPLFSYFYLHRTARNLVIAVRALHERGYVIGDVNESNILVSERALVTLVDTDSFQVADSGRNLVYRCHVGKAEYTPPELQGQRFDKVDRQPLHDHFGMAILLFQLLMEGTHPYAGTYLGTGDPPAIEKRIQDGLFPWANDVRIPFQPSPIAPDFLWLDPMLRHLFIRSFQDGYLKPILRPDTQSWQYALEESEKNLIVCPVNSQHFYYRHLDACPWCIRAKQLGDRDPFPSVEAVKRGDHLQPQPKPAGFVSSPQINTQGVPLPKRIPMFAPSANPAPVTGSTGSKRHPVKLAFRWPQSPNYWAGTAFCFGLLSVYSAVSLSKLDQVMGTPMSLMAIFLGVGGHIRSQSWEMSGRGRLMSRTAIVLGLISFIYNLW